MSRAPEPRAALGPAEPLKTKPATRPTSPAPRPVGVSKLADVPGLKVAADIESLLRMTDLIRVLNCSRRIVERLRSSGRLPKPDLYVGKRSPRWKPATIRRWIEEGGRP
jgi:predicted DNA-binding transcriptional regulator AlpA